MTGRQWKATGAPPGPLLRTCFKMTDRQHTAIGCQKKTICCLPTVKIRRRKYNHFMRFCPLQLQYHTNHLLRKLFRRHRAYISASK
ncbi:unnamed protein product [Prunus armeniaca]